MSKGIIALDADGVLLDYGLAYAGAWQKALGTSPGERDPLAYWPIDRWEVERVEGERLDLLRRAFDDDFWSSIPPVPGAVEACHNLTAAGYELVCVTALREEFRAARERDLRLQCWCVRIPGMRTFMPLRIGGPSALDCEDVGRDQWRSSSATPATETKFALAILRVRGRTQCEGRPLLSREIQPRPPNARGQVSASVAASDNDS